MKGIALDPGDPWFLGHFDGRPILPGIAHLALVERALGSPLAGVRSLRLRRTAGPGDVLDLACTAGEDGTSRFTIRCAGEIASNGTVVAGPARGTAGTEPAVAARAVALVDACGRLPHAAPALFLRAGALDGDTALTGTARVPGNHALARAGDGRVPALAAIEVAAQAAALFEALVRAGEGPAAPRLGYLVGARDVAFFRPHVPAEQTLAVAIRLDGCAPPLSTYVAEVACGDATVMRGTISTFLP